MKISTLLTAAALAACTWSTSFAQVQIIRSTSPTPAPRLVSDQTDLSDDDLLAPDAPPIKEATPNPFDYFSDDLPKVDSDADIASQASDLLDAQSDLPHSESNLVDSPLATSPLGTPPLGTQRGSQSAAPTPQSAEHDPASLPVGRHHRRQGSIVDTIIDQATLGNVPHTCHSPIHWGDSRHTPIPVAQWLLREECVDGLWANYPQQRAAECAQMWACLSGHGCGGHCGCGAGHCGTVGGPCTACAGPRAHSPRAHSPRVHNRYLETHVAAPVGCDSCDGTCATSGAGGCSSCDTAAARLPQAVGIAGFTPAGTQVHNAPYGAASTTHRAPGQLVKQTGTLPVAQLPSLSTYR
jgi:hypothetical protein